MADKPPVQTSGKRIFNDISHTDNATHVYVKVDKPQSLCPKYEGPYSIISRPSRSTVEVKLGVYSTGEIRKQVYHWSSCKVAVMRDGALEGARPKLGRPPKNPTDTPVSSSSGTDYQISAPVNNNSRSDASQNQNNTFSEEWDSNDDPMTQTNSNYGAKSSHPSAFYITPNEKRATRNKNPTYVFTTSTY